MRVLIVLLYSVLCHSFFYEECSLNSNDKNNNDTSCILVI